MRACVIRVRACVIKDFTMNTCYADTSQISKLVEAKPFVLPKFGESRTDPTYYEPTATRIANMRKSASSGVALYDYEGDFSKSDIKKQTREHFLEPAREIGITREELSQIQNTAVRAVDEKIETAKKDKQSKDSAKAESLQLAKEMASAVSGSNE